MWNCVKNKKSDFLLVTTAPYFAAIFLTRMESRRVHACTQLSTAACWGCRNELSMWLWCPLVHQSHVNSSFRHPQHDVVESWVHVGTRLFHSREKKSSNNKEQYGRAAKKWSTQFHLYIAAISKKNAFSLQKHASSKILIFGMVSVYFWRRCVCHRLRRCPHITRLSFGLR